MSEWIRQVASRIDMVDDMPQCDQAMPSFFVAPKSYHAGSLETQRADLTNGLLLEAGIADATCVVDVGCGAGQTLCVVENAAPHAELIGLDPDHAALAASLADRDRVHLIQGEGERLPFAEASVSHVICRVALNYMDQRKALAEMARILQPGGFLILSCIAPGYTLKQVLIPQGVGLRQRLGNLKDLLAGLLLQGFGWQGGRDTFWGRSVPYTPFRWLCQLLQHRGCKIRRCRYEGRFLGLGTIAWLIAMKAP